MAELKCKICGGSLAIEEGSTVATCEYCGVKQTLPKLTDEHRAQMYDRANHFRRNSDYDKAMSVFEQILNEDKTDAEAYWSIVLCRYGIEYVEDPSTHKRKPTVNRTQFTSIFADEDYKAAIENADALQREIYKADAETIDNILKGILSISQKEEPFDVFICYKETDNAGRRTPDSVLANDLYHQLTQEGLKVFFARITLEDKIGEAYEPYIFAALNSAKVMVVLGTKPEYFKAVWVKNEWSRFLNQIKAGAKKALVPAYKDMDPYDLPDEFSNLQAQDMSKLGFMQDLIRGIKKITVPEEKLVTVAKENITTNNTFVSNTPQLLKRATLALEDKEFLKADEFAEQTLNMDAENPEAYLIKLLAEYEVSSIKALSEISQSFENSNNYKKVLRFGNDQLKQELSNCLNTIKKSTNNLKKSTNNLKELLNGKIFMQIMNSMKTANYLAITAILIFTVIGLVYGFDGGSQRQFIGVIVIYVPILLFKSAEALTSLTMQKLENKFKNIAPSNIEKTICEIKKMDVKTFNEWLNS